MDWHKKGFMMKSRNSLTVIQLNDSHAYFDLHQEMFWQRVHKCLSLNKSCNPGANTLRRLMLK